MKLYVVCPYRKQRIYLSSIVERRSQIDAYFTIQCPFDGKAHAYSNYEVEAEPTLGTSVGGAIIGGLIGAIVAGPLGAILLGGLGLAAGTNTEEEERRKVKQFYEG